MNNAICFILGTRPEIIKTSPVIKECEKRGLPFLVIHTGQHYSYEMDSLIFKDLYMPDPGYRLEVGSGSHGFQTAHMLEEIEATLVKEKPGVILVQGDTNSVLAGALASSKLHIKIGHIEAGLRSYDKTMPEEINRILVDHMSEYLFAPTLKAKENLLREGIESDKIFVTGNTIVDSILQNAEIAGEKSKILSHLELNDQKYFLLTLHRAENTDSKERLENILKGIKLIMEHYHIPIIWPLHPRTRTRLVDFNLWQWLQSFRDLRIIDPVGFLDFVRLQAEALLILTDSGGIQEESCILHIPCVTLRDNTERPESIEVGANYLAGADPYRILRGANKMLLAKKDWQNPFGEGKSSQIIVDTCLSNS